MKNKFYLKKLPPMETELKLIETCLKVLETANLMELNSFVKRDAEDILVRTLHDLNEVTQNEGYNPFANKEAETKGEDSQIRSLNSKHE